MCRSEDKFVVSVFSFHPRSGSNSYSQAFLQVVSLTEPSSPWLCLHIKQKQIFSFYLLKRFIFTCVYICVSVSMCMCVPMEARRGSWITWIYRGSWATDGDGWVLGPELLPSTKAASAFNCWVTFSSFNPQLIKAHYKVRNSQYLEMKNQERAIWSYGEIPYFKKNMERTPTIHQSVCF